MENNKLREIEQLQLGGPSSVSRLIELSNHADEEVRFRAIEALGGFAATDESQARVLNALTDTDDLVRTAAVEVLGSWKSADADSGLAQAISDSSELVRSAAIVSLAEVGSKESIWILERKYQADSCGDAERLSCAIALYVLGRNHYLSRALEFLTNDSYQLRCAAANLLSDFTATGDIPLVLKELRSSIATESTAAARSSMENAIEALTAPQ